MPQRKRDSLSAARDPLLWRIAAGSPVWVAQKATWDSNGILRLYEHKMQRDMDFCGPVTMNVPGSYQPDYSLPRELHPGIVNYCGHRLRFCSPHTVRPSKWWKTAVENINDIQFHELLEEGLRVFFTGNNQYPFIVCRDSVISPIVE